MNGSNIINWTENRDRVCVTSREARLFCANDFALDLKCSLKFRLQERKRKRVREEIEYLENNSLTLQAE